MTIKRRKFLKNLGLIMPLVTPPFNKILASENEGLGAFLQEKKVVFKQAFNHINDRVWMGRDFWAVPMEDWEIKNKRLEFTGVENKSRLHLLTYVLRKDS